MSTDLMCFVQSFANYQIMNEYINHYVICEEYFTSQTTFSGEIHHILDFSLADSFAYTTV